MHYTEYYNMRHYAGFSQIGSHIITKSTCHHLLTTKIPFVVHCDKRLQPINMHILLKLHITYLLLIVNVFH